jgi:PAS domain S-box-containing protein
MKSMTLPNSSTMAVADSGLSGLETSGQANRVPDASAPAMARPPRWLRWKYPLLRYGAALALVVVAGGTTRLLWRWFGDDPSLLFFAAAVVSTIYGGLGPGLLSVFCAAVSIHLMFSNHEGIGGADAVRVMLFLVAILLMNWMRATSRRAQENLRRAHALLETRVEERTAAVTLMMKMAMLEVEQRRRSEQSLRVSEARKAAILDASLDIILTIDQEGRITESNVAAARTFGYESRDLIGMNLGELVRPPPEADGSHRWAMTPESTAQRDLSFGNRIELPARRADGTEFPVEVSVTRIKCDGPAVWSFSARDITARKTADQERTAYERQLRDLASQLRATEQKERRRIAIQLHDGIGQLLAVAQMNLDRLSQEPAPSPGALVGVRELIEQAVAHTRSLTSDLSPAILYEAGLLPAIEWLVAQIHRKHGLSIDVRVDGAPIVADEEIRVLVFTSIRELVMNIVKHARVSQASISLCQRGDRLTIVVEDRGVGFDPARLHPSMHGDSGFGLFSIRERFSYVGGAFRTETAPGQGTRMILDAPVRCGSAATAAEAAGPAAAAPRPIDGSLNRGIS